MTEFLFVKSSLPPPPPPAIFRVNFKKNPGDVYVEENVSPTGITNDPSPVPKKGSSRVLKPSFFKKSSIKKSSCKNDDDLSDSDSSDREIPGCSVFEMNTSGTSSLPVSHFTIDPKHAHLFKKPKPLQFELYAENRYPLRSKSNQSPKKNSPDGFMRLNNFIPISRAPTPIKTTQKVRDPAEIEEEKKSYLREDLSRLAILNDYNTESDYIYGPSDSEDSDIDIAWITYEDDDDEDDENAGSDNFFNLIQAVNPIRNAERRIESLNSNEVEFNDEVAVFHMDFDLEDFEVPNAGTLNDNLESESESESEGENESENSSISIPIPIPSSEPTTNPYFDEFYGSYHTGSSEFESVASI